MPNVCNLCIRLVWLCHHKMVTMLQKQHIHFRLGDQIAILCTFWSRKRFTHFICREKWFTHFFCRESNLRTSSGKFLRVQFCHPESSDFLGLWSKRWGWSPNPNAVPPAGVEYGKHLCAPESIYQSFRACPNCALTGTYVWKVLHLKSVTVTKALFKIGALSRIVSPPCCWKELSPSVDTLQIVMSTVWASSLVR